MKDNELIKLGIALDYPINWSFEMVLRDLVQNFYDSIQAASFGKEFSIKDSRTDRYIKIILETKGHGFSLEWLNYVGGSTKTNYLGDYIGMYGEGFKMCMLSLVNNGLDKCKMESKDWAICPCVYREKVSNNKVKMLGYKYRKRKDDGFTRFTLKVETQKVYQYYNPQAVRDIMLHFFYKENRLFGDVIFENDSIALYRRNTVPCPTRYEDADFKGILYINGLARARINLPLAINLKIKAGEINTRNREVLHSFMANRIITMKAEQLDGRASYYFLIELYERWFDVYDSFYDVDAWYYCICNLVRNVASDKQYAEQFINRYPKLYYIERKGSDRRKNKLIGEVRKFAIENGYKEWCNLNPIFRLLGAQSLTEIYNQKKSDFFRDCNIEEKKKLEALFDMLEQLYENTPLYDLRPEILIIKKDSNGNHMCNADPLQFAVPDYSIQNRRKYKIEKLAIKSDELMTDDFMKALLLLYLKLIRAYCAEKSKKRAYMLTDLGEKMIKNRKMISCAKTRWKHA